MRCAYALVMLAGLAVAGCETQAYKESARMKAAGEAGNQEVIACAQKVEAMPTYLALKDKLPPNSTLTMASMELLTQTGKPTPTESAMLIELHRDGFAPCRVLALQGMSNMNGALTTPLNAYYTKLDTAYARLVKREISWGEFATESNQDKTTFRAEMQQAYANVKGELNRADAAEKERWAASARAASAAINASRPRTTYCNGIGGSVTCTTY